MSQASSMLETRLANMTSSTIDLEWCVAKQTHFRSISIVYIHFSLSCLHFLRSLPVLILLTLARSDAATFSKLEESHTGPIFYYSPTGSLTCRIRFDSVIDVHPDCRIAFDRLKERFEDQRYSAMFLPNRGDVVVFDNWRVMHARDEIRGLAHTRHHRRVWIEFPRREHQVDYRMGIRPILPEVEAEIRRCNQESASR